MKSPLHTEAKALIWLMSELLNRGCDGIVIESDCQQPINVILNKIEWPSLAAELDEIKLLSTRLHDSVFTFIPRNLNFRADSLAKGSRSRVECFPNRYTKAACLNGPE